MTNNSPDNEEGKIVYFNGDFVRKEEVRISPDDRGFLFADGVYEVLRSYYGKLFKAGEHMERLDRSLRELRIKKPAADFEFIAGELIRRNGLEESDARVYIQITRGVADRAHAFPGEGVGPTVYAAAAPVHREVGKLKTGVKIILVPDIRWSRCDIKSVALLPNVLASQLARESGADEAVFIRDGVVTEGTHTNVFAVFGGRLLTQPLSGGILAGITRRTVLDLCRDLKIPYDEKSIAEDKLKTADELMIVSTLTEVMPVVRVGEAPVADGKPGPITKRLQRAFRAIVES